MDFQFQQAGTVVYLAGAQSLHEHDVDCPDTPGPSRIQKPQSFQIISSGIDGLYGVGGQYVPSTATSSAATISLPVDLTNTFAGFTAGAWVGNSTDSDDSQARGGQPDQLQVGTAPVIVESGESAG